MELSLNSIYCVTTQPILNSVSMQAFNPCSHCHYITSLFRHYYHPTYALRTTSLCTLHLCSYLHFNYSSFISIH